MLAQPCPLPLILVCVCVCVCVCVRARARVLRHDFSDSWRPYGPGFSVQGFSRQHYWSG